MPRILAHPEAPTAVASDANADDLLSQLAGNEIDRLLQEAETSAAATPIADFSQAHDPNSAAPVSSQEDLKSEAAPELEQQIDGLLSQLTGEKPVAEKPAEQKPIEIPQPAKVEAAPAPVVTNEAVPTVEAPAAAPATEDSETAPVGSERSALLAAAGFETPDGTPISPLTPDGVAHDALTEVHPPKYLKPLIWINRPLIDRPPVVRRVLGGVAVVTFINAMAVMLYVLAFKKH